MKALPALLLVAALAGAKAQATDLRNVMTDLTITSWNQKDGLAPAIVWALAQDRDGYLWVGTGDGLFKFDGVRFSRWETLGFDPLPSAVIRSLRITKAGVLWIGFGGNVQAGRFADGHLTVYGRADGLAGRAVASIAEDARGVIWAGTDRGLFRFVENRWLRWTESGGIPEGPVYGAYTDGVGNFYVAHRMGVFERAVGAESFSRLREFDDTYGDFAQSADGTTWITDPTVGYRPLTSSAARPGPVRREGRGVRMVADRKGNLWIGTGGQGLWRARNTNAHPAQVPERASSLTGLLGDGVYALLEDRDGNIWAGTTEGLNRLTPRTIDQVIDFGLVRGIEADQAGRLWVATVNELFNYSAGLDTRERLPIAGELHAMATDANALWYATGKGLFRRGRDDRRVRRIQPASPDRVDSITADGTGGVWLTTEARTIVHWRDNRPGQLPAFSDDRSIRPTALVVDSEHRTWIAFDNQRVVALDWNDKVIETVGGSDVSHLVYRVILEDAERRLWFGGEGGLTKFEYGRFVTLPTSYRFPVPAITAIVTDEFGSLWLGTSIGVVRLDPGEFDRAVADPSSIPRYTVYRRSDGVAGTPSAVGFNRGAVRTDDGRLWFVTTRGLTVLDPHTLQDQAVPVSLRFEGALADDRRIVPRGPMTLPAGTRRLEIDYTAVNLTSPLKTRFRYRLDPFDRDWVDAGGRRQAYYTNLRPGHYSFHVAVTGLDERKPGAAATWELSVAPMFYQTTAFAVACAVATGLLVLAGWQLRERHLRNHFSVLLTERARLGREIHDTLLQGLVGMALQFDHLAHELAGAPHLQGKFLRMRDRLEEYIREARRSIWDLHTAPADRNLAESVRRAGEFATEGQAIALVFRIRGIPRTCDRAVEDQIIKIAQEATLNAVRHAAPTRLHIDLTYADSTIELRVDDDGAGFDTADPGSGRHYGIASMLNRAGSAGGALRLDSVPGRGTEIVAVFPAPV